VKQRNVWKSKMMKKQDAVAKTTTVLAVGFNATAVVMPITIIGLANNG
jgi:hypothetical protein